MHIMPAPRLLAALYSFSEDEMRTRQYRIYFIARDGSLAEGII